MAELDQAARPWRQYALMAGAVLLVLALIGLGLRSLLSGSSGAPKKPLKISLIPSTPPPPPPPKEEKKPEPPKEQKEVKVEQPVEQKDAPPPAPSLKMEGQAGDGPSAFAAGKVTSEDLSKLGAGGKGGLFDPFNNYAGLIKGELQRLLGKRNELRRRPYRVEVRVWVGADGSLERSELLGSSGDQDVDQAIRQALAALPAFSEGPPANMPQPIKLRIVTRGRV